MKELLDPSRPTLRLYYNDPDGCCAAAVVRRALGTGTLATGCLEAARPVTISGC